MQSFLEFVEGMARYMYEKKRMHILYTGPPPLAEEFASECWICHGHFADNSTKVLDHCHWSGVFLGWAHNKCNLNRRANNFTPMFAHNLQNYDLHHIVKALSKCSTRHKFTIIPASDEKYISLEMKIHIKSYEDKNGVTKNVYENVRFLDSYKFMLSSLEKLAANLPQNEFVYLDSFFASYPQATRDLLKQKGYYPYTWVDSFDKFSEGKLPALREWKNSLDNFQVAISKQEYNHAKRVFHDFGCKNFGDYHDLYLLSDTLILASAFEQFRKVCFATYGLDCTQFYTASNLTGAAFLKICKPDLQLLTQRDMLDLTESMIRGGVSSIYSKRLAVANNKYLTTYDPTKPSTFIVCIDANNLYGGIMEKFNLPLSGFEWAPHKTLEEILATPNDSDVGYIVDVDLDYPDELHDAHSDYPLAPSKEEIPDEWLSDYQRELLKSKRPKTKKLVQTLNPKKNYVLHYITLKLYVELGLKVTKVNRVLRFKQAKWLKPYIEVNTQKRKQATNKCDQDFYKLMSNSVYGKLCESKRNRLKVSLVRTEEDVLNVSQKANFSRIKIVDEDLAIAACKQSFILWDKPTIVGAAILDLAKFFMFNFHYNVMKIHFTRTRSFTKFNVKTSTVSFN